MALPDSFNKFINRFGESIVKSPPPRQECEELERPTSPFVLLSEEQVEFNFSQGNKPQEMKSTEDIFQENSAASSSSGIETDVNEESLPLDQPTEIYDIVEASEEEVEEDCFEEHDVLRSHRNDPMSKDQFKKLFDESGRLVNEHELRRAIFKDYDQSTRDKFPLARGIEDSIRKDVWKFLFELYPFYSTAREREARDIEFLVRYEALKARWKKLMKNLISDYEGVHYCPRWYSACPENAEERIEDLTPLTVPISNNETEESRAVVEEVRATKNHVDVMIPSDIESCEGKESNSKEKSSQFGLDNLGLICKENDELKLEEPDICLDTFPLSYEEKLNQLKLISNADETGNQLQIELSELHYTNKMRTKQETRYLKYSKCAEEPIRSNITSFKAGTLSPQDLELDKTGQTKYELNTLNASYKNKYSSDRNITPNHGDQLYNQTNSNDSPHICTISKKLSANLECNEVDNISEILADAMEDMSMEKGDTPRSIDTNEYRFNGFDLIDPETSPNAKSDESVENITFIDEGISDTPKKFPNPFSLSKEYINTQESLYSKSENFKSIDLFDETEEKMNKEKGSEIENSVSESKDHTKAHAENEVDSTTYISSKESHTMSCVSNPVSNEDEYRFQSLTNQPNNVDNEDSKQFITNCNSHKIEWNEEFVKLPNGLDENHYKFKIDNSDNILSKNETENKSESETKPHLKISLSNPDQIASYDITNHEYDIDQNGLKSHENYSEPDEEISNLTKGLDLSLQDKTSNNNKLNDDPNVYFHRKLARSPTGESLENLPPWIIQMISPSNSSKNSPKHVPKNIKSQSQKTLTHNFNKELLGIVENANKYIEKELKSLENSPSKGSVRRSNSTVKLKSENEIHKTISKKKNEQANKAEKINNDVTENLNSNISTKKQSSLSPPWKKFEGDKLFFNDYCKFKFILKSDCVDNAEENNKQTKECPYCNFEPDQALSVELSSVLGDDQLTFMEIQAQVYAARQPYNEKTVSGSIRVIDKDVPRTDRELPQFKGDGNPGLLKLRDALLTYAFFHPDVGYAQGMNDIMSRFLVVMDTEAEAYWMFVNYMEVFKNDFMEEGMLRKISLVEQLLMKMDRELYDFLQTTDMGLMFCHRWLLLNFKREFDYMEAIRLFEITSSRHLEVSSVEAELERGRERAKDFVKDSAGSHFEEVYMSPEYPFDIFVCVAMLTECRDMIMKNSDVNSVYQILSHVPKSMDLQNILRRSEELFYKYCRKSVVDCFQVIDELEVPDLKKKKSLFTFR